MIEFYAYLILLLQLSLYRECCLFCFVFSTEAVNYIVLPKIKSRIVGEDFEYSNT